MWNERYSDSEFFYGTEPNDFLRSVAGVLPWHGKVLCLAEGEGRNAVYLAGLGFQVHAVDGSDVGLAKMQKLAQERGVQVTAEVADLADFEIQPRAWDAIVSVWCHLPSELRRRVHVACVAGLKPGGVFVLEAYTPKQLENGTGGPKAPDLLMPLAELRRELTGLDLIVAREVERDVREGKGHTGESAVVQVVAKKLQV